MSKSDQAQAESSETAVPTADGTPEVTTPEAPASETHQPTTTPPEAPAQGQRVAGVDDYQKMLAAALAPAPQVPAPAPQTEPTPGQPAEEPAAPAEPAASPDEPPATPDPATPPDGKREFRPRLSNLDERAQEAIALVKSLADKGEKISLSEAERRVNLKYGITEPDPAQPPAATEPPATVRTIEQIDADLAAQKEARKAAVRNLDADAQLAAEDAMDALRAEREAAQAAQRAAEAQQQTEFERQVDASQARAAEVYPVVADASHPIHTEAARIWDAMEATGNPLLQTAEAPFKVFQMAANNLGIAPGTPSAAPQSSPSATPKPQAVQQQAVRRPTAATPAPGGVRTTQPGPTAPSIGQIRTVTDYERTVANLVPA